MNNSRLLPERIIAGFAFISLAYIISNDTY